MLRVKGLGTCDNGRQDQHQHHPPEPAPARAVRIHAQQHKRERGHPRAHSTLASNRYDDSSLRGAPVRLSRVRAVLPVRGPPRRAAPSASLMKPREKDGRRSPPTRIRPREHGTCAEARPDLPLSPRTHLPIALQGHHFPLPGFFRGSWLCTCRGAHSVSTCISSCGHAVQCVARRHALTVRTHSRNNGISGMQVAPSDGATRRAGAAALRVRVCVCAPCLAAQ